MAANPARSTAGARVALAVAEPSISIVEKRPKSQQSGPSQSQTSQSRFLFLRQWCLRLMEIMQLIMAYLGNLVRVMSCSGHAPDGRHAHRDRGRGHLPAGGTANVARRQCRT